jgi:hypothetical protein
MIDKNWRKAYHEQRQVVTRLQYMDFTINCVRIKNSTSQLQIVSVGYAIKM